MSLNCFYKDKVVLFIAILNSGQSIWGEVILLRYL